MVRACCGAALGKRTRVAIQMHRAATLSVSVSIYSSVDLPQCRCTPVPMYPSADVPQCRCTPVPMYPSADVPQCRCTPAPKSLLTKLHCRSTPVQIYSSAETLYRQSSTDKAPLTKLYRQSSTDKHTKLYRQSSTDKHTKLYRQTHKALPTKLHCRSTPLPIDSSAKLLQCRSTPVPKSSTVPLDFVNCIRKIPYPKLHKRETRPQQCDSVPPSALDSWVLSIAWS
jgi:hypothetical protein